MLRNAMYDMNIYLHDSGKYSKYPTSKLKYLHITYLLRTKLPLLISALFYGCNTIEEVAIITIHNICITWWLPAQTCEFTLCNIAYNAVQFGQASIGYSGQNSALKTHN